MVWGENGLSREWFEEIMFYGEDGLGENGLSREWFKESMVWERMVWGEDDISVRLDTLDLELIYSR